MSDLWSDTKIHVTVTLRELLSAFTAVIICLLLQYFCGCPPYFSVSRRKQSGHLELRSGEYRSGPHQTKKMHVLTVNHLPQIMSELEKVKYSGDSFYELGLYLGISTHILTRIQEEETKIKAKLRRCIEMWLRQANEEKRNWPCLLEALRKCEEVTAAHEISENKMIALEILDVHEQLIYKDIRYPRDLCFFLSKEISNFPSNTETSMILNRVKEAVRQNNENFKVFARILKKCGSLKIANRMLEKYNGESFQDDAYEISLKNDWNPKFSDMQHHFKTTFIKVTEEMQNCAVAGMDVDRIKNRLKFDRSEDLKPILPQLINCDNITDLMLVIQEACTLVNIKALDSIAELSENDNARTIVQQYKKNLTKFRQECFEGVYGTKNLKCEEIKILVNRDIEDGELADVEDLLKAAFDIAARSVRIVAIRDSTSFIVTCSFPLSLSQQLIESALKNLPQLVQKNNVSQISIGYCIIYDSEKTTEIEFDDLQSYSALVYESKGALEQLIVSWRAALIEMQEKLDLVIQKEEHLEIMKQFDGDIQQSQTSIKLDFTAVQENNALKQAYREQEKVMHRVIEKAIKENEEAYRKEFEDLKEKQSKELQLKNSLIRKMTFELQHLKSFQQKETRSIAERIKEDTTLSEAIDPNESLCIYKLKINRRIIKDHEIAMCEFGRPNPLKPTCTKVIMLMGATGAGKSTLINGMVNYILGVKFENDFRFKLICDEMMKSQAHSQTDNITAYTLFWQEGFQVPYNLTIIDTPGFGDTRGMERDKKITTQVKELFSIKGDDRIDQIHAVGFVTQSALVRLTAIQRYVFDSVLEIFGKDIKGNIFVMATFADSSNLTSVIQAVKEAKVPFATSFPFNNSGLYPQDPKDEMTSIFWKMGYNSFQKFFTHIHQVNPASLLFTWKNLKEREKLETTLCGLQNIIQEGLGKMDTLRKEEELLQKKEADIKANEEFIYDVVVTKKKIVNLAQGESASNCLVCSRTCHYPCGIPTHQMFECGAMDIGGEDCAKCEICPDRCSWRDHRNQQYLFEYYEEVEIRTSEDLLKRYQEAAADKINVEHVISKLQDELDELSEKVQGHVEEVKRCLACLKEIALKPNPMEGGVGYLDLLIQTEKQEQKKGYENRIKRCREMKEQALFLAKAAKSGEDTQSPVPRKKAWWQFWSLS